jgi:type II secretory pathway predicted ATPase ExeA
MYLSYYSLHSEPFHITPDPDFLFLNESHKEALASIIYGIEKRKGFIAITGGIGLGKTTIVRAYLETKDDGRLKIIYVFNANITFKGLLKTIYQELELENDDLDIFEMVNRLHLTLIAEYEAGNNIVLIIDEAQNMPVETLENLRMLSNLETSTDKLIQIVFIGQPEFDSLINRPELRQLKQRIAMRTTIQPLNSRESVEYITHRLNRAGLKGELPFTTPALHSIAKGAKGVPRTINILCDNALITGFGCEQRPVGLKVVREVLSDFAGKKAFLTRWPYVAAAAIALALIVGFLLSPYGNLSFKWVQGAFFTIPSKQDIVRVPIRSEVNPGATAKVEPEAVFEPMLRGEAKKNGQVAPEIRTEANPPNTGPSLTKPGQVRRRTRSAYSASGSSIKKDSGNLDTETGIKKDDSARATAPSQVDIAKDVDNRLIEMIRQGGPVAASANMDKNFSPKAIEQPPAQGKNKVERKLTLEGE